MPKAPLQIRKPDFDFSDVPRDWLGGKVGPTHLANALHMLFPAGERFFIRSVRRFADRIDDPGLRQRVKGFIGQEVRHGMEHEKAFERLEEQGYDIRSFLDWYERLAFQVLEPRMPAEMNLAVTVALEHFTTMFASQVLEQDYLKEQAHPAMRDLLLWHACEELEHKSVAFEVLRKTNPSWALRAAGLGFGATVLLFFWMAGVRHLVRQEPKERRKGVLSELWRFREHNALLNGRYLGAFVRALHPDFHPDQVDDTATIDRWLGANGERLGLAAG